MKKYKSSLYLLILGVIEFGITIIWQNSLGDESKTTEYFWIILFIQLLSLGAIIVSFVKVIIIWIKELNKRE